MQGRAPGAGEVRRAAGHVRQRRRPLHDIAADIDQQAGVRVLRRARRGIGRRYATRTVSGGRVVRRSRAPRRSSSTMASCVRWCRRQVVHHAVATGAAATRSVRGVMSRAASLKRWPGWVLLVLVVAGLLAVGSTRCRRPHAGGARWRRSASSSPARCATGRPSTSARNPSSANINAEIKAQVTTTDATDDEIIAYIVQQFEAKTSWCPGQWLRVVGVGVAGGRPGLRLCGPCSSRSVAGGAAGSTPCPTTRIGRRWRPHLLPSRSRGSTGREPRPVGRAGGAAPVPAQQHPRHRARARRGRCRRPRLPRAARRLH